MEEGTYRYGGSGGPSNPVLSTETMPNAEDRPATGGRNSQVSHPALEMPRRGYHRMRPEAQPLPRHLHQSCKSPGLCRSFTQQGHKSRPDRPPECQRWWTRAVTALPDLCPGFRKDQMRKKKHPILALFETPNSTLFSWRHYAGR